MTSEPRTAIPEHPAPPSDSGVHVALVLLAVASGAADAFAFLQLGGIFTANMTGNLVLAGMFTRPGWPVTLAGASTAVVVFAAATYWGFRASPAPVTGNRYPRRSIGVLAGTALVAQGALVVVWIAVWTVGGAPVALVWSCVLVALSAAALGVQTVLAKRLSGASGLTTTFVTGTLTSLMEGLAERRRGARAVQAAVVVALVGGAVAGTALAHLVPPVAPLLPLLLVAVASVILLRRAR
jgi:uncharacterized membrane protein YoaK (UPF0700 family)